MLCYFVTLFCYFIFNSFFYFVTLNQVENDGVCLALKLCVLPCDKDLLKHDYESAVQDCGDKKSESLQYSRGPSLWQSVLERKHQEKDYSVKIS